MSPSLSPLADNDAGSHRVADDIVRAIVRGELLPGQSLPEQLLAGNLGVSRIPLREALRTLEAQGVVERSAGRGIKISDFSDDWAKDLYHIRVYIETAAAKEAGSVFRSNPEALALIDEALARIGRAVQEGDRVLIHEADMAFHQVVMLAAGSGLFKTIWNAISRHVLILFALESGQLLNYAELVGDHERLLRILMQGSADEIEREVADHIAGRRLLPR